MDLHIYLTPNAKSNSISADGEDMFGNVVYKCRVAAPPKEGEANKALILFLSDLLAIPKSTISITRGIKSRHKVVTIDREDLSLPF
ncbi:MAG: DUF167 domain-containing protein [Candidatus Peribacteria bacterium]|nr:MAG: DUF167 domain-containing protein [Candidatus Peribacteria bacterium]